MGREGGAAGRFFYYDSVLFNHISPFPPFPETFVIYKKSGGFFFVLFFCPYPIHTHTYSLQIAI